MRHDAHGYWIEEAGLERAAESPPLDADTSADVVVVGGGYTGHVGGLVAQAAEPDARVVLLEADRCGFGPERPQRRLRQLDVVQPADDAGALRRRARRRDGPRRGESVAGDRRAGARSRRSTPGSPTAATCRPRPSPHFDRTWEPVAAACEELGERGTVEVARPRGHPRPAAPRRCSAAAPSTRSAATVQPARLADGLRERLLEAGVEIHEGTTGATR